MKPEFFYKNLNLKKYIGKKHLDFGCGRGELTNFMAKNKLKTQFVALDIDKEKIKIAKRENKRKNIKYQLTSKIIGSFDSVTMIVVPHEIKALKKTLKEIHKHLKTNGKVMVYEFKKTPKQKYKIFYKKSTKPNKKPFEQHYKEHNIWTMMEFNNIMVNTGFSTIKIKPDRDYFFTYIGIKK